MIQTVKQRAALEARREPYWMALSSGRHIGYRSSEGGGHWIARAYDSVTRKRVYRALPDVAAAPGAEQFTLAVRLAREWFDHLDRGGTSQVYTVRQACERYVQHLEHRKGAAAAYDARIRFERCVYPDAIAVAQLPRLTSAHLKDWRKRVELEPAAPPKRGRKYAGVPPPPPRARSRATINRDLTALRAALNLAKADDLVTSDNAWKSALAPFEGADGRRTLYLTMEQRRALVAALPADLAAFVSALSVLPLRPGALAALRVADFDKRSGTLRIAKDKSGGGRTILLPPQTAQLMAEQARNKTPAAFLFTRRDGQGWNKEAWKKQVKRAVAAAGLPSDAILYSLRHAAITDLVTAGLDLFTTAQLAGTSVAMIEKHYGHLQQEVAREALARLVL